MMLFSFLILLVVFITAPLLAAWGTYRITPRQKIGIGGPIISQFQFNATGAFAAYIVVMLVIKPWFFDQATTILSNLSCKASWSIEGSLSIEGQGGQEVREPSPIEVAKAAVYTTPTSMHSFTPQHFTIRLPDYDYRNTVLIIDIPKYGGGAISFWDGNMDVKDSERKAMLKKALVIKPVRASSDSKPTSIPPAEQ